MNKSFTDKTISDKEHMREQGRVIARGMHELKVEQQKNMATAEKRRATMLERDAERLLSGKL